MARHILFDFFGTLCHYRPGLADGDYPRSHALLQRHGLPLSYAEPIITDKGIQGARLMLKEAKQAGRFVGYDFDLTEAIVPRDADVVAKAKKDGITLSISPWLQTTAS